jgi:TctA family transporter
MDLLATALPARGEALTLVLQPQQFLFLVTGVLLGLSIGVLPGLGGIAGLSLVLPFMFGMEPVSGLALMVGLIAVIPTSDTFSSVLLGIPGSTASQATVLDGFPLARKGEAARALAAAFASSLFGGLLGAAAADLLRHLVDSDATAFGTVFLFEAALFLVSGAIALRVVDGPRPASADPALGPGE